MSTAGQSLSAALPPKGERNYRLSTAGRRAGHDRSAPLAFAPPALSFPARPRSKRHQAPAFPRNLAPGGFSRPLSPGTLLQAALGTGFRCKTLLSGICRKENSENQKPHPKRRQHARVTARRSLLFPEWWVVVVATNLWWPPCYVWRGVKTCRADSAGSHPLKCLGSGPP